MMYINRVKKIIFYFCIVFLFLLCLFYKNYKVNDSLLEYKDNLILNIIINGQICAYDSDTNLYYYSTGAFSYNNLNIKINSLSKVKYIISEKSNDSFSLHVYNNKFYEDASIIVTSMPIISLNTNLLKEKKQNINSNINLIDESNSSQVEFPYVDYFAEFSNYNERSIYYEVSSKLRGSSSSIFPKKSYKIEFNEKVDLYDLPKDDKYILDALYIDRSMIRNLLSSDIWNLINDNQVINNDLYGRFVEVFIDNEYKGLYVIKDKVTKKKTKLDDNGVFLKSISHISLENIDDLLNGNCSINDNIFLNYEIKKYNRKSFDVFVSKLRNYYSNYSYDSIDNSFYMDNFLNYKIFVSLISGNDNLTYNQYLSLANKDSKILITPWDMDLTWGLDWNTFSQLYSHFSFESSYDVEWMNNSIISNMDSVTIQALKDRYFELRKNVITMDVINKYIDSYKSQIVFSSAGERNADKWYDNDVELEIENLRKWAYMRIDFLDEYFENL